MLLHCEFVGSVLVTRLQLYLALEEVCSGPAGRPEKLAKLVHTLALVARSHAYGDEPAAKMLLQIVLALIPGAQLSMHRQWIFRGANVRKRQRKTVWPFEPQSFGTIKVQPCALPRVEVQVWRLHHQLARARRLFLVLGLQQCKYLPHCIADALNLLLELMAVLCARLRPVHRPRESQPNEYGKVDLVRQVGARSFALLGHRESIDEARGQMLLTDDLVLLFLLVVAPCDHSPANCAVRSQLGQEKAQQLVSKLELLPKPARLGLLFKSVNQPVCQILERHQVLVAVAAQADFREAAQLEGRRVVFHRPCRLDKQLTPTLVDALGGSVEHLALSCEQNTRRRRYTVKHLPHPVAHLLPRGIPDFASRAPETPPLQDVEGGFFGELLELLHRPLGLGRLVRLWPAKIEALTAQPCLFGPQPEENAWRPMLA
mmetsp:Transcript_29362/g.85794  ORF Transcript_29362/g.85794 Transcript_29362/m.85794 type:complete len:430 (-) Transcript_29362:2119-3408(-)